MIAQEGFIDGICLKTFKHLWKTYCKKDEEGEQLSIPTDYACKWGHRHVYRGMQLYNCSHIHADNAGYLSQSWNKTKLN